MHALAAQVAKYMSTRRPGNVQFCRLSTQSTKEAEIEFEQEAEKKIGWLLKLIFAGTATAVAYQFFPYMGDNLIQQSVSLLHVKDPLFKRMGASRLARFAIDDERRMKIIEMGGDKELVNMLKTARDDKTQRAALTALRAVSRSDKAAGALYQAGALSTLKSISDNFEDDETRKVKADLLKRFQDLKYDSSSS